MTKSGPPTSLEPSEYEAIEKAMMETSRGRWFLAQFAEKNRRQDTQVVLEAIAKLESSVSNARSQPESDRIKTDLVEMSKAIERTRYEIANLKLPDQEGGNLVGATEELDAIVSATERATNKILQAAEDIQETAWIIREDGGSIDASCARIDNDVTDIYTACSFQDITGQRTQKVVQVLTYLESRINAMVSIWGLATDDSSQEQTGSADNQLPEENKRPDAHLLNGPQMEDEALKQHHIDDVMAVAENQDQPQPDTTDLQSENINSTDIEPEPLEEDLGAAEIAENIVEEETSLELDDDLQQSVEETPENSLEEETLENPESIENAEYKAAETGIEEISASEPAQEDEQEDKQSQLPAEALNEPEQQNEIQENAASDTLEEDLSIEEDLPELEENSIPEPEEEAIAENLLSDLEEMATTAVEENLSDPEPQLSELETAEDINDTLEQENEGQLQEQAILDHIENAELPPEDDDIKETILAEDIQLSASTEDTAEQAQEENTEEDSEKAAFEQHFKKISEELQKAKQLKAQTEADQTEAQQTPVHAKEPEELETETPPLSEEETAALEEQEMLLDEKQQIEAAAAEENSDKEFMENQENTSEAEEPEEEKTAEELRKLSPNKKSALFQ